MKAYENGLKCALLECENRAKHAKEALEDMFEAARARLDFVAGFGQRLVRLLGCCMITQTIIVKSAREWKNVDENTAISSRPFSKLLARSATRLAENCWQTA
jgi:hypothetical protein